jgi:FKBP-type peptidyl-prolyl cis-trans isomerase
MNAQRIAAIAGIAVAVALAATVVRLALPDAGSGIEFEPLPENEATTQLTDQMNNDTATQEGGELGVTDVREGTGAEAVAGQEVTVHYVGTLPDGTKFDSSRDRGEPFTFDLGAGQVIQGWDQGVAGMKVGGVRKLVIPPALGYGSRAVGSIPADSTLHFEVELLAVEDAG